MHASKHPHKTLKSLVTLVFVDFAALCKKYGSKKLVHDKASWRVWEYSKNYSTASRLRTSGPICGMKMGQVSAVPRSIDFQLHWNSEPWLKTTPRRNSWRWKACISCHRACVQNEGRGDQRKNPASAEQQVLLVLIANTTICMRSYRRLPAFSTERNLHR